MKKKNKKNKKNNKKTFPYMKKTNVLILASFFMGILLITATYAWFYASLNVKINMINMTVSDESGLYISLDGVNYGNSIEISQDKLLKELEKTYPTHITQWPSDGMYAVSSNGHGTYSDSTFDMFSSTMMYKDLTKNKDRIIETKIIDESKPETGSQYAAFDIFFKNITGSPYEDNLFLVDGSGIKAVNHAADDYDGTINSIRLGFLKFDTVSKRSDINTIQNMKCGSRCLSVIYEPNSKKHSKGSIERAVKDNVNLVDGWYFPTYAVIKEGKDLDIANGQKGSRYELDTEHFAEQKTITSFDEPIFGLSTGITKVRVYVWVEGQDIDSLEIASIGADLSVTLNFYKDLAGYEQ